ncbi:MAG TPA: hypothetical protein DEP87_02835, partial [Candidatus Pacebacteria bacterium]|nr:hypothetical protein [Candidatus Paceibacterota bacterium]
MTEMTESRKMHQAFYGQEAPLTQIGIFGIAEAPALINFLIQGEFQKIGEAVLPPELRLILSQLAITFGQKFESVIDHLREAASAESLRQLFGTPQIGEAVPVAIQLTSKAETAYALAQQEASRAAQILEQLKAEIRRTILIWYLAEEARHQAELTRAITIKTEITQLGVTTAQAKTDGTKAETALDQRSQSLKAKLEQLQITITKLWEGSVGKALTTAEN